MGDASVNERGSEHVRDAVLALINAQTWVASRDVMRAEQDNLFASGADKFFAELLTTNQDNSAVVRLLTSRRALLAQAKTSGIEAAYAGLITPRYISSLQQELQTLARGEPRRVDVVRALLGLTDDDNRLQRAHLQNELAMSLLNDNGASRASSLDSSSNRSPPGVGAHQSRRRCRAVGATADRSRRCTAANPRPHGPGRRCNRALRGRVAVLARCRRETRALD